MVIKTPPTEIGPGLDFDVKLNFHQPPAEPIRTLSESPRSPATCKPAVILLGGGANALSVARNLGRDGIVVYAINEPSALVRHSRHARWLAGPSQGPGENTRAWAEFLLSVQSDYLRGAILLACSDAGIKLIAENRAALQARFLLDASHPRAQLTMLNKLRTYEAAAAAGVATPRFWVADTPDAIARLRDELVFPLIIKPHFSHLFEARTGKKFVVAQDFGQVLSAAEVVSATGSGCLLLERIPGPDDRLCSYYTYLDENGDPLFHFTKRIIRRYPTGMGGASYHMTDWVPELVEPALKLFRHVGLRGLANVEFKRDVRDGQLKLIECNARFTAADCLVARSGINLASFVYNRITGRPQQPIGKYKTGLRLWDPGRDWSAFCELRQLGEITLPQWLASIAHRQTFQWFAWSDPMPAVARALKPIRRRLKGKTKQG